MSALRSRLGSEIPHLRRYARALVGCPHDADDLVQASLERALRREAQWQPDKGLRSWLFRILHNLHVSDVRGRHREVRLRRLMDHTDQVPEGHDSSKDLDFVHEALERLHPNHRQAILLIAVEGFSYEEASSILGVPVGTMRSRLSRAREGLRALLPPVPMEARSAKE